MTAGGLPRSTRYHRVDESADTSSASSYHLDTSSPVSDYSDAAETPISEYVIQISDNEVASNNGSASTPLETIEDPLDPLPRDLDLSSSTATDAPAKSMTKSNGDNNGRQESSQAYEESGPRYSGEGFSSRSSRVHRDENTERRNVAGPTHDERSASLAPGNEISQAQAVAVPSRPECSVCILQLFVNLC